MSLLEACEKEITQNRETFVQFGDRSHCFQLPQHMVIFMSISQTVNIWSVLPFGVQSRPQGCSHQCFHFWHYTVRNTDLHGNWLLLQPMSGTEGGWKPNGNSGSCLGNPIFTTRTCHQCYPGWLLPSPVPDTEPGSDPGTQKKGWRGMPSSAAPPFPSLCPPARSWLPGS